MKDQLDLLLAEKGKSPLRLKFSGEFEVLYRNSTRNQLRLLRTLLMVALAAAFALAPFQEATVFRTPLELRGSLILFSETVTPVSLIAALLTWYSGPRLLTQSFQTAAVLSAFSAILALRYLALTTDFQYPAGMMGLAAIAVATFGGFGWYRMLSAFVLFIGLAIAQEFAYQGPDSPILATYQLSFSFIIAVTGSLANEWLRRQNWLQHALATAVSRVDPLTGLSNRADFERRFQATLTQARREQRPATVMVLDVDYFKQINDKYGHVVGDRALRAVADAIADNCAHRPLDIKARAGGEEFLVVWYDVSPVVVPALVQKVLDAIKAIRLEIEGVAEPLRMTASAGACWAVPSDTIDRDSLIQRADALMYQAKNAGRDRACLEPYAA